MDNFFCSHRCTFTVRLWLGTRRVSALARPALSVALLTSYFLLLTSYFLLLAPSSLALAKMLFFVVPDLGDVLQRPPPMLTAVHSNLLRRGNLTSGLPSQ